MLSRLWKGAGKAALVYGIAEFFLGKERVQARMKKIGWGALTIYIGGKLVFWGLLALLALIFFQLAGWEFLVKPVGIFGGLGLVIGLLLIWQGVNLMRAHTSRH